MKFSNGKKSKSPDNSIKDSKKVHKSMII